MFMEIKMKDNTKKYIENILKELEIQLNTTDFEIQDLINYEEKCRNFIKKLSIIVNLV